MLRLVGWLSDGSLKIPTPEKPRGECDGMDMESLRPFDQAKCFSLVGDCAIGAFVSVLFFHGGPTTVGIPAMLKTLGAFATTVVAFIVDAIQRVPVRRSFAHVSKEVVEGSSPSLADADAASAIVVVLGPTGPIASTARTVPGMPFGRFSLPVVASIAMLGHCLCRTARSFSFGLCHDWPFLRKGWFWKGRPGASTLGRPALFCNFHVALQGP